MDSALVYRGCKRHPGSRFVAWIEAFWCKESSKSFSRCFTVKSWGMLGICYEFSHEFIYEWSVKPDLSCEKIYRAQAVRIPTSSLSGVETTKQLSLLLIMTWWHVFGKVISRSRVRIGRKELLCKKTFYFGTKTNVFSAFSLKSSI